jgi:LPS-assembly protein
MLTSRLLDPQTGAETLRAAFGQRFYFTDPEGGPATGPSPCLRTDRHDRFPGLALRPDTSQDLCRCRRAVQPATPHGAPQRRRPLPAEAGKVVNAGYRYSRPVGPTRGQIDISGQWPLFGGWHAVGRVNYSTKESRMIESVVGLEYDGGCWVGRVVMQRLATQTQQSNTALFFQLELNGFAKVGSNPLDILKRNVPGYGVINQQAADTQRSPNDCHEMLLLLRVL